MSVPHDHSQEGMVLEPPRLEEVADGIFGYVQPDGSWGINNTGFVVGPTGVTVVDTCFTENRTKAFIQSARQVTSKPLRTLINTHHHGDHTFGNGYLPDATIIAHELCREEVINTGFGIKPLFPTANFGELILNPPFVTFEDRIRVYSGDLKMEVFYAGPAHTSNDVVVWIPEKKVLFTGDIIFKNCTPFIMQGALEPYFAALERLRALGAETIVPGHGPVCGPESFDEVEEYLRFLQTTARKGFEAGLTPLELARQTDLGQFAAWHDSERIVGNLYRAYSELRGEPPAAPLPFLDIWREAQEYSGHPLRCFA